MKRIGLIVISSITVILIVIFFIYFCNKKVIDLSGVHKGETYFLSDNKQQHSLLSESDKTSIIEIFNKKKLYKDNPSCGFSENVSIKFDDSEIFYIANDSCPVIYWKNKDYYFRLSDDEYTLLVEILNKYGFIFPCV